MSRIEARFAALKKAGQKAFIPFITAGDPDLKTCAEILEALPGAGADLIELGMPFSDPMADGPVIERANNRAFASGITLKKILGLAATFRKKESETPLILMGYANPIYTYGIGKFVADAKSAGIDGLIVADLPPEEDGDLRLAATAAGIDIIRLVAPTTDAARLQTVLKDASGFLYYVSVAGITGSKQATAEPVRRAVEAIRKSSALPVVVGFGISTPEQAREIAAAADGVVVGSAIVNRVAARLDAQNKPQNGLIKDVLGFVEALSKAAHNR